MQSVPITTKVVSSNPVHGEVYSIQHHAISFVSDLATDRQFSSGPPVSSTFLKSHMLHIVLVIIIYSNMTLFKRVIDRLGIIPLAQEPVHVTDFPVVNVHVDELSSARI